MAPCVDGGLVTLATCKPQIRRSARPGDWIAGFLPRPHPRGLLTYVGRVHHVLDVGIYEKQFRGRADAVYRLVPDGTFRRLKPDYHDNPNDLRKDTSSPVLIFDEDATWYFGDRPQALPPKLIHLSAAGRGHRVNGAHEGDVKALERWLRRRWSPSINRQPQNETAICSPRQSRHCGARQ